MCSLSILYGAHADPEEGPERPKHQQRCVQCPKPLYNKIHQKFQDAEKHLASIEAIRSDWNRRSR